MPKKKIRISDIFKRLKQKLRTTAGHELMTYLVFLLIAVVIWYMNALNKDYTTDLKFKVKYTDMPEDKVLVNSPPGHLKLTVNAQGFTLLKYKMGLTLYPITLEANYHTMRRNSSGERGEYFLVTQSAFDKIAVQLSFDVKLRSISPDTIHFLFSETVNKKVPVKPHLQLYFGKEFLPKGPMQVSPATVTVTGPHAIIDTMQYVYTREKTFKRLKDTLRTEIALQQVEKLRYSSDHVDIVQPIERHTEATITVPIEPVNLPEGFTMKTFPGTVTVSCMVSIIDFEKLQPYMFRVVADYASIKDTKDNQAKVKLNLLKSPDYISDVKFQPKNVEFIIEK